MNQGSRFRVIAEIVLSLIAPGAGHLLGGMWLRGASWLGGVFAGGTLIYYLFPSAEIRYYSAFGAAMALATACDLLLMRTRPSIGKEEPVILKPDANA
jgi:hypothetical protein